MRWALKYLAGLCLVSMLFIGQSVVFGDIRGFVQDSDNQPVLNASVRLFSGARELDKAYTGETGGFEFLIDEGNYTVLVYGGDSYLPAAIKVDGSLIGVDVTLSSGALVEFSGDMQFVDTESLPLQTVITVLDQQGEPIVDSGFSLVYGTEVRGPSEVSELSPNQIMIPTRQPVSISLNSSYLMGSYLESRSVQLDVYPMLPGGVYRVDLREYTIPLNRGFTDASLNRLEGYCCNTHICCRWHWRDFRPFTFHGS